MKVLFVSSGNKSNNPGKPGAVVYNQGESLKKQGVNIDYFLVKGKGLRGYIKEGRRLKKYLKKNSVSVIHAHYTLSGWVSLLALPKHPIVLSLMGTDAYGEYIGKNKIVPKSRYLIFLTYIIQPFVKAIICKSKHIQSFVYLKRKSTIIPNGVFLENIHFNKNGYRKELGLKQNKRYVLFIGDKENKRKNYQLLEDAFNIMDLKNTELIAPYPIPHDRVVKYLNSADVLVVPSFMEGSPNIVKEAMACNCPVVATDVGDVQWLFGNEPGHYICDFDPQDVSAKIEHALNFVKQNGRTNGRQRILELGLDAESVAERLVEVYEEAVER